MTEGKDIRHLTDPLTVQHEPRQVIEDKLLMALEGDGNKVAVVFSETDLDVLIDVLLAVPRSGKCRRAGMLHGLRQLREAAFGRF